MRWDSTHICLKDRAEEIVDFMIKEGDYLPFLKESWVKAIKQHIEYGTLLIVTDKDKITAMARWNWVSEDTVHIMDVVIIKKERRPKRVRELIALGVSKNPNCKYIRFERQLKKRSEFRQYSVDELLKRRKVEK